MQLYIEKDSKLRQQTQSINWGCIVLLVIALTPLFVSQFWIAPAFMDGQRASCGFLESALAQLSPEERVTQPQTAEQCIKMVEASSFMVRFIVAMGSYVVPIVVLGFIYTGYLILSGAMSSSKRKRKNTSETGAV